MKRRVLWLLLVAGLAVGCKKAEPAAPAVGAGTGSPAAPANAPDDTGATLRELSLALRKHVVRTQSAPKDFEDFVAQAKIQVPPPPAGKKYAIAGGAVVLVDR